MRAATTRFISVVSLFAFGLVSYQLLSLPGLTARGNAVAVFLPAERTQLRNAQHRDCKHSVPDWLSEDPMIREQELTQWDWEARLKQRQDQAAKTIRLDFHQQIQEVAASPQNQELQAKARMLLENATKYHLAGQLEVNDKFHVFDDIIESVELDNTWLTIGKGLAGQRNNIVGGKKLLQHLNGSCVVYGAGIAYETSFEVSVAKDYGCAVHAFDCTMRDPARLRDYLNRQSYEVAPSLAFHPWCIGEEKQKAEENATMSMLEKKRRSVYDYGGLTSNTFLTLDTIMNRLGHEDLDILKFDIEGFEWNLLDVLLGGRNLPRQIHFELHAKGANRGYVPEFLTKDKDRSKVVELFQRLFNLGYRVITKELNHGDSACAEFVLYRFYDGTPTVSADEWSTIARF